MSIKAERPWFIRRPDDVLCNRNVPTVHLNASSPPERIRFEIELRNAEYVARYYQRRASHTILTLSRNWEAGV